jgi:hypothetical protein
MNLRINASRRRVLRRFRAPPVLLRERERPDPADCPFTVLHIVKMDCAEKVQKLHYIAVVDRLGQNIRKMLYTSETIDSVAATLIGRVSRDEHMLQVKKRLKSDSRVNCQYRLCAGNYLMDRRIGHANVGF